MAAPLINRGELWHVDLPDVGAHPGVVVSRQVSISIRTNVAIALVTTSVRGLPTEVPLNSEIVLSEPSVANCDEIYTVRKASLTNKLGELRFEEMLQVERALRISLDLRGPMQGNCLASGQMIRATQAVTWLLAALEAAVVAIAETEGLEAPTHHWKKAQVAGKCTLGALGEGLRRDARHAERRPQGRRL